MMTLREFLEKVNTNEHYRIYQPNRDCLVFESYFKVHSPYRFSTATDEKREWFQHDYWDNNDFCDDIRSFKEPDEETKEFLERFGDFIVFRLECGSFLPTKMYKDETGKFRIKYYSEDPLRPGITNSIPCFNIFILPLNAYKTL